MKKKIFALLLSSLFVLSLFILPGCEKQEKDPRQHITMLVYERDNPDEYLCELSEENKKQTITVKYRAKGWEFNVKAKFPNGQIQILTAADSIARSAATYTSPEGEVSSVTYVKSRGTYEYFFEVMSNNKVAYPFIGRLTIDVI